MVALIGIFFSSDTGNTEKIANMIHEQLGNNMSDIFDIATSSKENIETYNKLIFGIPTWYYGEPQCDWDTFLPILKSIDFSTRKIAIFGCGDQEDYSEYFCDAMRILYDIALKNGGKIVGLWPSSDYHFEKSKSVINNNQLIGLAIDEDRQPEMTDLRVKNWLQKVLKEMGLEKNYK